MNKLTLKKNTTTLNGNTFARGKIENFNIYDEDSKNYYINIFIKYCGVVKIALLKKENKKTITQTH